MPTEGKKAIDISLLLNDAPPRVTISEQDRVLINHVYNRKLGKCLVSYENEEVDEKYRKEHHPSRVVQRLRRKLKNRNQSK